MRGTFGLSLQQHLMAGAAVVAVASARPAEAQVRNFDVPAQPAAQGIPAFARQAGVQIIASGNAVRDRRTNAVHGPYSVEEGLRILLNGTGLAAGPPGQTGIITVVESAEGNAAAAGEAASSSGNAEAQIVVTGSRLKANTGAIPARSYSRETIAQSGRTTLADFLNSLPDASVSIGESNFQKFAGQETVQLHGLPAGTTLTLLDGHKVEPGGNGYFDLSNIPLAMIARIDVLPIGSSAIYGSDALAGAVNIILRRNFSGFELNAKYGTALGNDERDIDSAWGMTWGDKASIALFANYQTYSPLFGRDRAVTSSPYTPSGVPSIFDSKSCNPANVSTVNGTNLPGLNSNHAIVPETISGIPTISDFQTTAGQTNLCSFAGNVAFIPETNRAGIFVTGHYQLTPAIDVSAKVIFSKEHLKATSGNLISFSSYVATANNPYNPFGTDVAISYSYNGIPRSYTDNQQFMKAELGAKGHIFGDWSYETTASYAQSASHISIPTADSSAVRAALASSNPEAALNPFTTGVPGSASLLKSLQDTATIGRYRYVDERADVEGLVHGTIVPLPAGALEAVAGAEWSHERQQALSPFAANSSLSRNNYSVFTEERVPILSRRQAREAMLALSFAGRYDHSSDFGGKATWQTGVEFRPLSGLLLRGGYATSYLAPQLSQLNGGFIAAFTNSISDPARGGQVYSVPVVQASNSNLRPETGRSLSLGAVYNSGVLPGLGVALTWYRISIHNYIGIASSAQTLVTYSDLFPGAIVRAAPTSADKAAGYLGQITNIEDLYFNYGSFDVSGVDFDAKYAVNTSWGNVTPSLSLTYTYKWASALTPGAPIVSYLNQASYRGPGFAPAWKGTLGLAWNNDRFSAAMFGRYVGRYKDYQDFAKNQNHLGGIWYVDANFRRDIGATLTPGRQRRHAYIQIGAVNLFNELPQSSFGPAGFDPNEADLRGRFIYAQLGVHL